jgi:hypothetical protein
MAENLSFDGEAQDKAPAYVAPEQIAQVVFAAEAAGSSDSGRHDANTQYYWPSEAEDFQDPATEV